MPQITLEYTDNIRRSIDFAALFTKIHDVLTVRGGIRIENCKSRAIKLTEYSIGGSGSEAAFVHLDIAILAGRSLELQQKMGREILAILRDGCSPSSRSDEMQITVEIRELKRELYFKIPEGSLPPPA